MTILWQVNARGFAVSDFIDSLRNGQRPFDYSYNAQVKSSSGLYSFWARGTCLYVGMSENLRRRIGEHAKNECNMELRKILATYANDIMISIAYLNYNTERLLRCEAMAIRELRPIANNTPGIQRYK